MLPSRLTDDKDPVGVNRFLTRLQQWALGKAGELRHSNQAAIALANAGADLLGGLEARTPLRRQLPAAGSLSQAGIVLKNSNGNDVNWENSYGKRMSK